MANYTGDPTATEAPSPPPTPGVPVVLNMPTDGEPVNAATWSQPFKALADFCAWLFKPRAQLSAWAEQIMTFFNARMQARFAVDHMGYPAGYLIAWEECFDRFVVTTAFPTSGDPWTAATIGSGNVTVRPPGGVPAGSLWPRLELAPGAVATAATTVWRIGSCRGNTSDLGLSMRWKAALSEVGTNRTTIIMGLTDAASSLGSDPPGYGVYFKKSTSDLNWQCYYKTGAGTLSSTSTVVAPTANQWQDFRIEILGANVADDSAGALRFYINDVLLATMSVDVSTLAGASIIPLSPTFTALTTVGSGANVEAWIAAVKYRHNTAV